MAGQFLIIGKRPITETRKDETPEYPEAFLEKLIVFFSRGHS